MLKHLLFKAKKRSEQISVVGRIRTCAGRPQWFSSLSPLPLGHDNLIKTKPRKKSQTKLYQGGVATFKLEHCFSLALKPQKRHTLFIKYETRGLYVAYKPVIVTANNKIWL